VWQCTVKTLHSERDTGRKKSTLFPRQRYRTCDGQACFYFSHSVVIIIIIIASIFTLSISIKSRSLPGVIREDSARLTACPRSNPDVAAADVGVVDAGERISGQGAPDAAEKAAAAAAYMLTRRPAW